MRWFAVLGTIHGDALVRGVGHDPQIDLHDLR
jgi:hypothetical protein